MEYNFKEIEKKWRQRWIDQQTYRVTEDESRNHTPAVRACMWVTP